MVLDMHHIISDAPSLNTILEEINLFYKGETLPPLRLHYKDVSAWQTDRMKTDAFREAEDFWLKELSGELPVLDLLRKERPRFQSFEGERVDFTVQHQLTAQLQELAHKTGTTLFMVLLSAYQVLLSRYSGQEDILVGTPSAGRVYHDLKINHKKVARLCRKLGILLPQRTGNPKYPKRLVRKRFVTAPNQLWQLDIKYGSISGSRRFFFVACAIDVFDRAIVGYYRGPRCTAKDITGMLNEAIIRRELQLIEEIEGHCIVIRTDNGPQFVSNHFGEFCEENKVFHERIPPRSPCYWSDLARVPVLPLPKDGEATKNRMADESHVVIQFTKEETDRLLKQASRAYRTDMNDILLTALLNATEEWTGNTGLVIDLEGHGRESIAESVDVSRTVGWFTTMFPVALSASGAENPGEQLQMVKEQLRRIPNKGMGYGLLTYLNSLDEKPACSAEIRIP
ncbi:condensation domain-containing protein [Lysinibacillus sphaericus]